MIESVNFQPRTNIILVRVLDQKTEGGLYIPEEKDKMANDRIIDGLVIAKGPKAPNLKRGDKVLFHAHIGEPTKFDDKDYLLMRETDVLAVAK